MAKSKNSGHTPATSATTATNEWGFLENLRHPVEVFEAASGNPEPLAQRVESGIRMSDTERAALAAFLRGELVPPKRGRGQTTLPHLARDTREEVERRRIRDAVAVLRFHMRDLRKRGERHVKFADVLNHVAKERGLSAEEIESALNLYKRGSKAKNRYHGSIYGDPAKNIVKIYQRWLLNTGRLPEFPQPISRALQLWIRDGKPDLKQWFKDLLREAD